jgi:hypothetical protein
MASIATQCFYLAQQSNAHGPSALRQGAGDYEAVAAVIAGSAQDGNRPGRPSAHNLTRDALSGLLHEQCARYTRGHRQSIRLSGLRDVEQ